MRWGRLDRELSVVRPFARKRGFVIKARTWKDLAEWESRRAIAERRCLPNERRNGAVARLLTAK